MEDIETLDLVNLEYLPPHPLRFLLPANEVCEDNVFTGVSLSTGECIPACTGQGGVVYLGVSASGPGGVAGTPPDQRPIPWTRGRHPLGRHPPRQTHAHPLGRHPPRQTPPRQTPPEPPPPPPDTRGYGQQAGGVHPTGMISYC